MQSFFLCFYICVCKTHKNSARRLRRSYLRYIQLTMNTSNSIVSFQAPIPTERKLKGRGNQIVEGTVVKVNIGELEEEVRAGNPRSMRKYLTGVVQGVSGRRRFLVRFYNGCGNNLSSNQLTVLIVEKIPMEEEPEVSAILEIPEDQVEK